jgi:glycosyltransferase involved in cell wall biosynthesis
MMTKKRLNVWLVTVGEPLPIENEDRPRLLRTGRLACYLKNKGHDVVWWTSSFNHFSKQYYTFKDSVLSWEGGDIRLLKSVGYQSNISLKRFLEHAGVARKFMRQAKYLTPPDVILVSFPTIELAYAAMLFGKRSGIPVIVDVRDLWPDVIINFLPQRLRFLARLVLFKLVYRAQQALLNSDSVLAVSDSYMQWALKYSGRIRGEFDEVIPLGYEAPESSVSKISVEQKLLRLGVRKDAVICWYVGTFGHHYDLSPIIEAARMFYKKGRLDVQFVISGKGDLGVRWRNQATDLKNVIFTGWIEADEINWMRMKTSIGLQPYAQNAPQGLANKLFEYLSAGIPVVSSLKGDNDILIKQYGCGLTYKAGDALDCYEKLCMLIDDPNLRENMASAAKRLFEKSFSSDLIFQRMVSLIENVYSKR